MNKKKNTEAKSQKKESVSNEKRTLHSNDKSAGNKTGHKWCAKKQDPISFVTLHATWPAIEYKIENNVFK